MNRKTICKVLKNVHQGLLETIDDPVVKSAMKIGSIYTGGCLASMLRNERVNDYDIYFRDKGICKLVAEYYVKKFIEMNEERLKTRPGSSTLIRPKILEENDRIKIIIPSAGIASETGTGERAYQFFESQSDENAEGYVDDIAETLERADEIPKEDLDKEGDVKLKHRPVFLSSNAITLSGKIQLVIRFYGSHEEIHKNYDYVYCMNSWIAENGMLILRPDALESILSKHLQYKGSLYPLSSIIRTRKLIRRGWHLNAGQYLKMCFQLSQLDLTNLDTLEDQLVGVDNAYFVQLIARLRDKQKNDGKFVLDMCYLESVIDRIF